MFFDHCGVGLLAPTYVLIFMQHASFCKISKVIKFMLTTLAISSFSCSFC